MPTLLQIADIGGGVIEVVYNDASSTQKSSLYRKDDFWNVYLDKGLTAVVVSGKITIYLSYEQITTIGGVTSPANNQAVYDALKAMMIAP